jgi:hypothetical protein
MFPLLKLLMKANRLLTIPLLLFFAFSGFSQSDFKSEEELKVKANQLFEERKFEEASPLLAQLLSLYPQDPNYNYKYAATLLSTSSEREKPLKYLKFAISKSSQVDPLAYYYLGRAHHLNYNFGDAVKYYTRFKQKGDSKYLDEFDVDRQIEMAKNGKNMLGRINEVQVIEKQVVPRKDFYRLYELEGIEGKIIAKPEDFRSKYDEKVGERSVIFFPDNANELYYSSYGKKGDQGKDIYRVVKIGGDSWSDPVRLGPSINTPYDEDYPFIHPDGRTLFFASKGHSSIGGFDLFKSTYDESTLEWTEPENLDFAFSTVDDDILFVTDQDQKLAYFASDRANSSGEITVYKVLVEKAPANLSVIKGKFIAENDPSLKKAKITVIDEASQKIVGIYETDEKGNYQVEIARNGGNYRFNIETTDDAPLHTGAVEIPSQDEFAVLGQELRLVGSGDDQQLVIKNIFDGTTYAEGSGPNISSETLKMKANLEVNLDAEALASNKSPARVAGPDETEVQEETDAEREARTVAELIALSDELNDKSTTLREGSKSAYKSAAQLKAEADRAFAEAGVDPKTTSVGAEIETNEKIKSAQELASRAAIMTALAQKMEKEAKQADKLSAKINEKSREIEDQLFEQEYDQAEASVQELARENKAIPDSREYLKKYDSQLIATMNKEAEALKAEEAKLASLQEDDKRIVEEIAELESGTSLTEEQEQQLIDLKKDRDDIQFQLKSSQLDYDLKQVEVAALNLEKGEVENLIYGDADASSTRDLSKKEKEEVVSELKIYRDNRQLAYMSPKSKEEELSVPSEEYVNEEISAPEAASIEIKGIRSTESLEKEFSDKIASTGVMGNEVQAKEKKVDVYEDWLFELDRQEALRREGLKKASSEAIRSQLEEEIVQIDRERDEITAAKAVVDEQLAQLENNQIDEAKDASQEEALNSKEVIIGDNEIADLPEGVVEVDVSKVDENTPFPSGLSTFDFDEDYEYASENAKGPLKAAKVALYQAKKYDVSADEARKSAYTLPTAEERREAFKNVNKFEKGALVRELEAMQQFGTVNQQEFYRNSAILKNLNNYDQDEIESTNLDLALLLQDEADTYFIQAEGMRTEAEADGLSNLSQKNKLQKAYDLEMLALSKQKQALESLKLVNAEVEEGAFVEEITSRRSRNANVQTITNPEVLAIRTAKEAKVIGDDMTAEADKLKEEAERLTKAANVVSIGPERDSLLSLAERKQDSANQLRSEAAVYYQRQGQLESGFIADASIDEGISRPPLKYTEAEYEVNDVQIDEERKSVVSSKVEYEEFLTAARANHQQVKAAEIEYEKAVELRRKQLALDAEAQQMLQSASQVDDPVEKERRVREARVIELKAQKLDKSIDSLNNIIKIKNFLVTTSENEMKKSVEGLSAQEQTEIAYFASRQIEEEEAEEGIAVSRAVTQEDVEIEEEGSDEIASIPTKEEVTPVEQTANIDENIEEKFIEPPLVEKQTTTEAVSEVEGLASIDVVPRKLETPIFQLIGSGSSAYSDENPIPNMNELPDGVIYKVQVGAFRNPISQDLFKGFAPLMAESGPNGITRYSAGLFDNEGAAVRARDQIRALGYKDAFVIVFRDGQRTSINAIRDAGPGSSSETTAEGPSGAVVKREPSYEFQTKVRNVENIQDLFFSVQIGVYSKEVIDGSFDSFKDVNAIKLPSGLFRYNAGIFNDLESAQDFKNQLSEVIPDAFVVAYYNGRRVSINEAARILNQNQ